MKIGFIVPGFAGDPADWCIPALTTLARALAARPDVDLHVFALRYPPRRDRYALAGTRVHSFGGAPFGAHRVWGASLLRLWAEALGAIAREHRHAPFAVLHGFWATESGYLAALAGRRLGIPTLVHLAGGELTVDPAIGYGNRRPGLARLLVAVSLRLANGITVPSGPIHGQLARTYPRLLPKAHAWAFGVDLARFHPRPNASAQSPGAPLRLVQAASLIPVKDQALLLEALARVPAGGHDVAATLTLAGDGPLRPDLEARARRLGLGERVRFAGALLHDALPELYRVHDVFVLTSRHEAQCLAVLEAGACGLPWIGPPVGALADLARDAPPSGRLVPPSDADALAAAIMAAGDLAARAAQGAAAARQIAARYALPEQTDRLLACYRAVARCAADANAGSGSGRGML